MRRARASRDIATVLERVPVLIDDFGVQSRIHRVSPPLVELRRPRTAITAG